MHQIALIDYGSGNLHSAHKALVRAATEVGLAADIQVTDDPRDIRQADRVVLPGVGAFAACMSALVARKGVIDALHELAMIRQRPFLGVCVGMQLLANEGQEYGITPGLGWIEGAVVPLKAEGLKVPHMGWNTVRGGGHGILPPDGDAYFVHSYRFAPRVSEDIAAYTTYGEEFPAMIARGNIAGVQFHPEKSQAFGLALLGNFLRWEPS